MYAFQYYVSKTCIYLRQNTRIYIYVYRYWIHVYIYIYIVYIELPDGGSTWQAGVTVAREV